MRVLITGAGAVGSAIAGAFSTADCPFVIMEEDEEVLRELRERGLELLQRGESVRLEVEAVSPRLLQGSFDVVFLAVKGPRLGEAMRAVSPRMHRDTFFLSLQAGWAVEALAEMVGAQRVVAGSVEFAARRVRLGVVEIAASGPLVVGELAGNPSPRLLELRELLEKARPGFLEITRNAVGRAWWSMRLSALLGPLAALSGFSLEKGMPVDLRAPYAALAGELEELMRLEGVEPESPFDEEDLDALAAAAYPYAASMKDDLDRGEPLEKEFTTGFLLERSKGHGLRTPALSALHTLLGELESAKRAPSFAVLRELIRRTGEERDMGFM